MFLTHDILVKYEACPEGIAFFDRHYPNGVELSEIIQMKHIPHSFLHWGCLNLTTTEEERALYDKVLGNINSEVVFQSENVVDSQYVIESANVQKSSYVYQSKQIENSHEISVSEDIHSSTDVGKSSKVYNSINVLLSSNVKQSQTVAKSNLIIESASVFDSSLISRSSVIYNSTNINDSVFIEKCNKLNHCMFCYDLSDKEYHIFNQPVDESIYNFIYEEYKMFNLPDINITDPWKDTWNSSKTIYYNRMRHFREICDNDSFIKWVKTLPNYSEDILYNITFSERVFKDDITN